MASLLTILGLPILQQIAFIRMCLLQEAAEFTITVKDTAISMMLQLLCFTGHKNNSSASLLAVSVLDTDMVLAAAGLSFLMWANSGS